MIIPVTVVAALLMPVFEVAIVHRLWPSTRDFARMMGELEPAGQAA